MFLNDTRTDMGSSNPGARPHGAATTSLDFASRGQEVSASLRKGWKCVMTLPLGLLLVFSLLSVVEVKAQQVERQDFGSGGIFSYVPPNGWTVSEFPGLKFKISHGAPVKGFAPNLVVVDEDYNESLDNYARDNLATLQKIYPGMKTLGQTDLKTSDGARAIKLITERDDDSAKHRLHQVFYFFDAGNKKLVATCSCLAEEASASDPVCDAAMKTFSVKPAPK
jgi:hypothetical protein